MKSYSFSPPPDLRIRWMPRRSSLARFSIHPVAEVSAGPPLVGLYLMPPSSGGLCEGVITMPSASPLLRRIGERVRVLAEEERPVRPLRLSVVADRLGDGEDVGLVEGAPQG